MTTTEWRKSSTRTKESRRIFDEPAMQQMLAILRDSSPLKTKAEAFGTSADDKAMLLGMEKGYNEFLTNLLLMGMPFREQKELVATFEPVADK